MSGVIGMDFDDVTASRLQHCAAASAQAVRVDGGVRTAVAQRALLDFDGAFARLFGAGCETERHDRGRLAGTLEDLAMQVAFLQRLAAGERERRRAHAAWRVRERERSTTVIAGSLDPAIDWAARALDPEPPDTPVRPRPIDAPFRARERPRTGGGGSGGRTSADPDRLREFVDGGRRLDAGAADDLARFRSAWSAFVDRCGWAPVENASVVAGFVAYLQENAEDAAWIERIAAAFDAAGGRSVANTVLDASGGVLPTPLQRLFDPTLSPAEVAAAWAALGLRARDIRALPQPARLRTQLRLANLDGLPAHTRDVASRSALRAARSDPEKVYRMLGLQSVPEATGLAEFREHVAALWKGLRIADLRAGRLPPPSAAVAQLIGFGVADGVLVAAIALGNVDTATNVTVNVPGANTRLDSATEKVRAARGLLRAAAEASTTDSFAVVSWFGYRTPTFPEVASRARADAGSTRLASFLDGMVDARADPPIRTTVIAHSYGSTTAIQALAQNRHRVGNLVIYGSAGLPKNFPPQHLNVGQVHATEAAADHIADIGRIGGLGRTDPREIAGVNVFSSEAEAGTKAVTGHDMYPNGSDEVGYLSRESTSLRHIVEIVNGGKPS